MDEDQKEPKITNEDQEDQRIILPRNNGVDIFNVDSPNHKTVKKQKESTNNSL